MTDLEKKLQEALAKLEGLGRGLKRDGGVYAQTQTTVLLRELIKEQSQNENSGHPTRSSR